MAMPRLLQIWFYYVVAPYWAITALLYTVSYVLKVQKLRRPAQVVGFFGRCMAFVGVLALCAFYGIFVSVVLRTIGQAGLSQWAAGRMFKWIMWPLVGIWFDIDPVSRKRLDETRPAVFLGNHQTEVDILFLGHVWPKYASVAAKSDLKYYPFLGQFMWLSNTVFINRGDRKSALAAFANAAEHMNTGKQSVFIFPEGTRSYYQKPGLLPFKKGAFHLAIQAQVPIVPVVCANYAPLVSVQEKRFEPGRIPVKVLEPVETKGLVASDVEELMRTVQEAMEDQLKEMHVELTEQHQNGSVATGLKEKAAIAMKS